MVHFAAAAAAAPAAPAAAAAAVVVFVCPIIYYCCTAAVQCIDSALPIFPGTAGNMYSGVLLMGGGLVTVLLIIKAQEKAVGPVRAEATVEASYLVCQ